MDKKRDILKYNRYKVLTIIKVLMIQIFLMDRKEILSSQLIQLYQVSNFNLIQKMEVKILYFKSWNLKIKDQGKTF